MLHVQIHKTRTAAIAEFVSDTVLLRTPADALDLWMQARGQRAEGMALHVANIAPEFFDLKTRLAGDILQKLVNNRCRLAIVGDISPYTKNSEGLRALVRESNRGKDVWFAPTIDALIANGW
jgi:hypothetical protein